MLLLISLLLLLMVLFKVYRQSKAVFSVPFLIMLYLTLLYLGAVHFYFTLNHYTYLFVCLMAVFYLVGIYIADVSFKSKSRSTNSTNRQLNLYSPMNPSVLRIALIFIFFFVISVAVYRLSKFGSPLFEQAWYTKGIASTTGIVNRVLFAIGVESLIIMYLISYGLCKSQKSEFFKYLSILFFVCYLVFEVLHGGKSTAVMPFILIGLTMYYHNREIPKKFLLFTGIVALTLTFYIGSFWTGNLSTYSIFRLFYERVTSIATLHLDYLVNVWVPKNSYQFGHTVVLEMQRIVAQVTSISKEPLFNEMIGNLRVGDPISNVTGASPEISLFGMGYANFGIIGAIIAALVFGFSVQRLNIYLLSRKSMNLFAFALWIYFIFKLLGFVRTGNVLISLESYLIGMVPALLFISIAYIFFAIPFPSSLKLKLVNS